MRIAALYDIHGNLPALEAVLAFPGAEEFARENILNPPESSKVIPIFEQMAQERPTS
ncbi:MAG TPA: hypothetical protein VFM39_02505 [bacterium]|nr:hypothetical protein [bacterium]